MTVSSFRDLEVWKKGVELAKRVYHLTQGFPRHEIYGINSQLQRAAVSIPANIAEGHARDTTKEFLRYISIAKGSLAELETLLTIAEELGYCQSADTHDTIQRCDQVSRMLSGLRRSLRRKTQ